MLQYKIVKMDSRYGMNSVRWSNLDDDEMVVVKDTITLCFECCEESEDGACQKKWPHVCRCDRIGQQGDAVYCIDQLSNLG